MPERMNTEAKIGLRDIIFSIASKKIKLLKLFDFFVGHMLAFVLPTLRPVSIDTHDIKTLLVIRPGGLGDAVFLLPILRAIRQKYPAMTIDILGEKRNAQVFVSQSDVCHRVFSYDNSRDFRAVLKKRYDLIVDTEQWHCLSAVVAYFIKAKCRLGFGTTFLRKKLFNRSVSYEMDGYELTNFKNLFSSVLNFSHAEDINNSFFVSPELQDWAAKQIPANSITLFLGASIPVRRFTKEQSIIMIRHLVSKQLPVVLLGGNDILRDVDMLLKEVSHPLIHNFIGKTTLEQSAALIERSRLFIGTDSGLMHVACAVGGTPVIAVFGPGNIPKWQPKGKEHSIISKYLFCSPCTRFGYTVPTCKGGFQCMRDLDMKELVKVIDEKIH